MSRKNMNFIDLDMEYGVKLYIIKGISKTYPSGACTAESLVTKSQASAIKARPFADFAS
jgi:hypothetical protein